MGVLIFFQILCMWTFTIISYYYNGNKHLPLFINVVININKIQIINNVSNLH